MIAAWRGITRDIDTQIHRLHCRFFEDDEWSLADYAGLYAPLVLFIAFEVSVYVIAGIVN